jgi:hypothetical protein
MCVILFVALEVCEIFFLLRKGPTLFKRMVMNTELGFKRETVTEILDFKLSPCSVCSMFSCG